MQCYSPILSTTTRHGRIWLPCGKCEACKQKAGKEWFLRILKHYQDQTYPSYFVTLTYATEHLPIVESEDSLTIDFGFDKKAIQLLTMQLRNYINQGLPKKMIPKNYVKMHDNSERVKMTHFIIAEKGDLKNRQHYHLMLFNVPYNQENLYEIINKLWGKGIVHVGKCEDKSICYITDYCVTKDDEKTEWRIMSKNIGSSYVERMREHHLKKMDFTVNIHDRSHLMPRYMRKKIFTEGQQNAIGKRLTEKYQDSEENSMENIQSRREALRLRIKYKKEKRNEKRLIKNRKNEK